MEKIISKINGQNIQIIESGSEKLVSIKPICQALGVDFKGQYDKIKSDSILSSTVGLSPTVAVDGKQREMVCLPLKYVFGWLFTINPDNVNPDASDLVLKYKMECYEVLYNYFTARAIAIERYNKEVLEVSKIVADAQYEFATARKRLAELRAEFAELRNKDIEEAIINEMSKLPFGN